MVESRPDISGGLSTTCSTQRLPIMTWRMCDRRHVSTQRHPIPRISDDCSRPQSFILACKCLLACFSLRLHSSPGYYSTSTTNKIPFHPQHRSRSPIRRQNLRPLIQYEPLTVSLGTKRKVVSRTLAVLRRRATNTVWELESCR